MFFVAILFFFMLGSRVGGRSKVGRTQGSALHVIGHRVIVDVVGGG